ncbi:hypothetical protein J6590_076822 [Homalodisca vitripennis]|nr:hypothetical protein J6590_076822 [Homalodisca vitripennis]
MPRVPLRADVQLTLPYTVGNRTRLEALQRRFLRLIGVRLGFAYLDVPVEELSSNLNLSPLALRRDVADVVLLWKIVNGRMNCPDLLAEIDLRVPANTRSRDLLGRRYHSTNFDFNSPFARFIRLGNQVASGCDLFFDGLHQGTEPLVVYNNNSAIKGTGSINNREGGASNANVAAGSIVASTSICHINLQYRSNTRLFSENKINYKSD